MKNSMWRFTPWASWSIKKYELLLENRALSGWILEKTACSFLFSKFVRETPQHIRYGIDYHQAVNSDYQSILTDDGWSLIDSSAGWYLWKKSYDTERPSLFTDKQSLIDRNKRLLMVHAVILLTQLPLFTIFWKSIMESESILWHSFAYFYLVVMLLLIISAALLLVTNIRFKKEL